MRSTRTSLLLSAAVAAAVGVPALLAAPAVAAGTGADVRHDRAGAVFVQSDDPSGNTVVAYHRDADGTLSQSGVYPTGGLGGVLTGSVVDHLASEGSLAYDRAHQLLYAVNAGSDTLTVFAVHGDTLRRIQTVDSGGSFPVGVAVHGSLVYVVNALDGGSIQGFRRDGDRLVRITTSWRGLGLDPSGAPQFTHTPGQIGFTPDGSALVVTTKAAANSIDVFPLRRDGSPAAAPVVTATPGAVPFGFTFDPAGRLQVTEVGPGAVATFTVGRNGTLAQTGSAATGQAATCWITAAGHHLYTSNAGSATLSGFRADGRGALTPVGVTGTDAGTVDAIASPDGHDLYVQTGRAGVVDEFAVGHEGLLTPLGSVTVPGAVGGEGIVAS